MNMLETERLILRPFCPDDWQDLFEYLSQESVVKYEPYNVFTEEACQQEAISRSQNGAFWAVCLKENNKLIGNTYFEQQQPKQFMTWEIGYVFNPAFGGQGFATESARAILRYGFEVLGAHRIIAMCNPENSPSWRLLERLSMRREGHFLQKAWFKTDEFGNPLWHDAYEYAILAEEYKAKS